ncbi:MAG: hypothetical protein CM15mP4_3720 [Candidatus Neomarinimicrobiota bacterium]|nr:MAG: hypothetical protein CM15mP4_3720 [Candidatus Neomarinimicrobiota bacterium]
MITINFKRSCDMAPSDQLYKTPPPRTNNTLDEVDIIKAEIKEGRVIVPHEAIIPVMMQDHLIMRNGISCLLTL